MGRVAISRRKDDGYLMLTKGNEKLISPPDLGEDVDKSGFKTDSPKKVLMANPQTIDDRSDGQLGSRPTPDDQTHALYSPPRK
jgi:hypothetical protein